MRLFLEKYISLIQFILLFTNFKFTLFFYSYYYPYSSIIDLKDCMLLLKLDSTEIRNLAKDATLPLEVKQYPLSACCAPRSLLICAVRC